MAFISFIYFYILFLLFSNHLKDVLSYKSAPSPNKLPFTPHSSPTISAVLLECPTIRRRTSSKPDCERQMMVHIQVSPTFQIETLEKFLLLDEVYDQRRQTKAKLMSPYLIEISRGEPVVMYPLQFSKSIRCDTCGHKNENKTFTSQGSLEHQAPVSLKPPAGNNFRAVASVHPLVSATSFDLEEHPSRSAYREKEQRNREQQQNDNKASMEYNLNPSPKISEKIESQRKLTIGILNAPSTVQQNSLEDNLNNSETSLYGAENENDGAVNGNVYDSDDYDEGNFNDEALIEDEEDFLDQNGFRSKRLKVANSRLAMLENEQLFHEAERQDKKAYQDTIMGLKMKPSNDVGRVVGGSALGGDDEYSKARLDFKKKTHHADLENELAGKRFDGKINDDFKFEGKNINSNLEPKFSNKNVLSSSQFSTKKNGPIRKPGVKLLGNTPGKSGDYSSKNFLSNSNANNAFHPPSGAVPESRRQWQYETHQNTDNIQKDSTKRKFPFKKNLDTQQFSGIGSNGSDAIGSEDYERIDASVHDSNVIESKRNIAKTDDIKTVDGGMGDEFYWNTLHYPQETKIFSKSEGSKGLVVDTLDAQKIGGSDSGKYYKSLDQNIPKRLNNNHKTSGKDFVQKGNNESLNEMKYELLSHANRIPERNNNDRRTVYDNSVRRTPSKKRKDDKNRDTMNPQRDGSKASENFFDKSAVARMKIRNSDAAALKEGGGSGGVVETSGVYTGKDSVVPAFPLNGYPGYLGGKISPQLIPRVPYESQYKILENVPQEYLPNQPEFAKEIADTHLTVDDKINLLAVLSTHDDDKDDVLKDLENDLDSSVIIHDLSNHDKMPIPSSRYSPLERNKKRITKREYLMYDDLTMRETDGQFDEMDLGNPLFDSGSISKEDKSESLECNEQTCHDRDLNNDNCLCDRQGRNCKCPKNGDTKIRSVSDAWYSVFNMSAPLQFLTTRIGIYRRRHEAWWKIAPSITLTSLSGIYASENLSILFSSHVDIFQLQRPFTLEKHKLLIRHNAENINTTTIHPSQFQSIDPNEIFAVDSARFDFNKIHDDRSKYSKKDDQNDTTAKRSLCHATSAAAVYQRKRRSHSSTDAVLSIGDLGYFPSNMNILEQCPSDPNHLCLNMLDEEVPAFTIKIKQPFRENVLIFHDVYKVRIASIVSDATTKGALQVVVVLVNEDFVANEFTICICDCPMTCGAKTTVKKDLAPSMGETISFLLPLGEHKDTKLNCNVEVKSPDQKVISKRKFIVEPTARCLCIWNCDCHCIQDLISYDEYNVCHKLSDYEKQAAGFIEGGMPGQEMTGWRWFWWRMNHYAFSLLLCMLFLGFLKAILGALCLRRIDRCGYDYVQPLLKYDYASRCRRFFINLVFFVVLPFIFCCKCFTPNEEDLLIASTEWQCSLVQHDVFEDSYGDDGDDGDGGWKSSGLYRGGRNDNNDDDDDDEDTILSQHLENGSGSQVVRLKDSQLKLTIDDYMLSTCEFDDEEEERDKNFVLQALAQSRESIRTLLKSHCSEDLDSSNPLAKKAEELVRRLVEAKIVYRTFNTPQQNVDVSMGQKYSIRGYFMPSLGPGYEYITPTPLAQIFRITDNTSVVLIPPNILQAENFSRVYNSKLEVLDAGDLSVEPPEDAPCINSSNTTNESQLTIALTLQTPPSPRASLAPVSGLGPTSNGVLTEAEPEPANDTITRSDQFDDANNGSNLMAKQKDLSKGDA